MVSLRKLLAGQTTPEPAVPQLDRCLLGARAISKAPLPYPKWWAIISRGAKHGTLHWEVQKELIFAETDDPQIGGLPGDLEETSSDLPPISQLEALALLDKFIQAETGGIRPGASMHPLHWLTLTGHYAQCRERFQAIEELVAARVLEESEGGIRYHASSLQWPLIMTSDTVREVEDAKMHAMFPTFARWDRAMGAIGRVLPNLLAAARKVLRSK